MRSYVWGMMYLAMAVVAAAMMLMAGCSSSDDEKIFLNVSERPSWGPAGRVALTAWGGNEVRYIYTVNENGGGLTLLTAADKSDDFGQEGGWHPAYRPTDGATIAFTGRRSKSSPREAIYWVNASVGDKTTPATLITAPAAAGADAQPSWKPDASGLVLATTEFSGTLDLATVAADSTGRARVPLDPGDFDWDNADEMWPVYTPDGKQIVFECRLRGDDQSDIWVYDTETGKATNLTASNFDDGAPSVQPAVAEGLTPIILFHSNRNGAKYDIWAMDIDGGNPRPVTQTNRSDGFPVWSPDGTRVAFVRDREVWTMKWTDVEADRDYIRLTRRFR
jgi:Tol biopolymer transport system component